MGAPGEDGGDVLVLGAGFSRAVSDRFPLTDELGDLVRDELKVLQPSRWLPDRPFENGYFEAWLSSLAEEQPDLDEGDNKERQALFARSIALTGSILRAREAEAGATPKQDWLSRLLGCAHACGLTMISLNYDTVIEAGVSATGIYDWTAKGFVQPYDALHHLPPRAQPTRFAEVKVPTFALLKLHGSLDWYWVPDDRSGATIQRAQEQPPGLSPFLTPPAASKSAFYANPISRELWRRAGRALAAARRVALVGYSLPVTDLTVSGMLQRHIEMDEVELVVVNPDPGVVTDRLVKLGATRSSIVEIGGEEAVAEFVSQLEARASEGLLTRLRSAPPYVFDAPLVMGPNWHSRVVDSVEQTQSGPVLMLSPKAGPMAGRVDADPNWIAPGRTMRDFLSTASGAGGRLKARLPDGTELTIVDHHAEVSAEIERAHVLMASTGFSHLNPERLPCDEAAQRPGEGHP